MLIESLLAAFLLLMPAERYGAELSAAEPVRIAQLLESPEKYVDQKVKVVGLVEDICPMEGCWIQILEEQSQKMMRFKVQDGVIVFPAEAKGREVVAEGILRAREMRGNTVYQIEGLGAEVKD